MMVPEIVAEGAENIIHLYLQNDSTGDGKVDEAVDLTNAQVVEVHLRKFVDQSVVKYKTTDNPTKVTIIDADGTQTTINGQPASHVILTLDPADVVKEHGGYDLYVVVVNSAGKIQRIPNKDHRQVLISAEL